MEQKDCLKHVQIRPSNEIIEVKHETALCRGVDERYHLL